MKSKRLVSYGATFGYDVNGDLISKTDGSGNWNYTWDYENSHGLTHAKAGNTLLDLQCQFNAVDNITLMIDNALTQLFL